MVSASNRREAVAWRGSSVAVLLAAVLLAFVLLLGAGLVRAGSAEAEAPVGALSQLPSPFSCVDEEEQKPAFGSCGTSLPFGLHGAYQVQVSPDGRSAYSVAIFGDLDEYSRDPLTGALTAIGCVTASTHTCKGTTSKGMEMAGPAAVAISPDGASAYAITQGSGALVEFERDPGTGLLKEIGCIGSQAGSECATKSAKALDSPYGVTVSPDGRNVYVASLSDEAIAEFSRNSATGLLEAIPGHECLAGPKPGSGCPVTSAIGLAEVIGVVVSPDGASVYAAAGAKSAEGDVAAFARQPETGALEQLPGTAGCISELIAACSKAIAIQGGEDLTVSPDDRNVYANSFPTNAVVELRRNPSTGALTQLAAPNACVTSESRAGCNTVKSIGGPLGVAISPDGDSVYVSSASESAEGAFARDPETGALAQLPDPYECLTTNPSGCGVGSTELVGLEGARRVTVSPDGRNVYVAGQNAGTVVELGRVTPPPPVAGPEERPSSPANVTAKASLVSAITPSVAAPLLARTGNIAPVSGKVLVRLPATSSFVALSSVRQIPFGTVINATNGRVSVTTAAPHGGTQSGEFFEGEFILTQGRNGLVVATLAGGDFSVCPTARERAHRARTSAAHASPKHVVRKLWANAHGSFSTKGNYAAGAVEGTEWLTEDLCDGTLIRVTRDRVAVTNLVKHRHLTVKTGHSYLAKSP